MNRLMLSFITVVFCVLLFSGSPSADNDIGAAEIISHPAMQKAVLETAKKSPFIRARNCKGSQFTPSGNYSMLSPKHNASFIAKQAVKWKGCGQERTLNILVTGNTRTKFLRTTSLAPGDTRASPILQIDAGRGAMPMVIASTGIKNCKAFYIDDTKLLNVTGDPAKSGGGSSWDELWTFSICEKKVPVIMHFTPDATGTTFSAQLKKSN